MNFKKLPLLLPLSLLACLALSSSASAKNYTLAMDQYGGTDEMAPYNIKVSVPKGWKLVNWNNDRKTGALLSRKVSKKCLAVMNISASQERDYEATEPRPQSFIEALPQNITIEGVSLTSNGPLTNKDAAPGGFPLSTTGHWGVYSFREDSKPAFLGASVYYGSQWEDEESYFTVPFFYATLSQNQGIGGTGCKVKELKPLSKTMSSIVKSAQVVSG